MTEIAILGHRRNFADEPVHGTIKATRVALSTPTTNDKLRIGIAFCWLSLAVLPLGLMGIVGGPCAGPRNAAGSTILLVVGFAAVAASVYGVVRILQFFGVAQLRTRLLGILSLLCACFAT